MIRILITQPDPGIWSEPRHGIKYLGLLIIVFFIPWAKGNFYFVLIAWLDDLNTDG